MKPRNFKCRKLLRQLRAYRNLTRNNVPPHRQHEAFILFGALPIVKVTIPKDIRIRLGQQGWRKVVRGE